MSRLVYVRSREEVEAIRAAARVVADCLRRVGEAIRAGVTTGELDGIADDYIRERGGRPAFKGYRGFPSTLCVSVNEEVVHGIPSGRRLAEGDIVGVDVGVEMGGYYADSARTFPIGEVGEGARRLLRVTEEALYKGIEQARAGNRVGDISNAIQRHVEGNGFAVVKMLVGHGIGREMHEEPKVPNYGPPARGPRLMAGQVIAIEPMVNAGGSDVDTLEDGWTVVTHDRSLSAHFEHTVAVWAEGSEILSRADSAA
jgi:methionyl aminopeptidase